MYSKLQKKLISPRIRKVAFRYLFAYLHIFLFHSSWSACRISANILLLDLLERSSYQVSSLAPFPCAHPPSLCLLSLQKSFQVDIISFKIFFKAGSALLWPFITLSRSLTYDPCVAYVYTAFLIAIIANFPEQISTLFKDFSIWCTIYFSILLSAIYHEDI